MIRPRRIASVVLSVGILISAIPEVSAGVIRYVVGEKTYADSPELDEHFRPSSVYSRGSKYDTKVVDTEGNTSYIPQNRQLGKIGTIAVSWNKAGDVVGSSYVSANENTGFLFRNGELTYLSDQLPMTSQGAKAINERGQIVGGNWPLNGMPYFYEDGVFVPLNVLPGFVSGRGTDINESGLVVGDNFKWGSDPSRGVLYAGTNPYDLTSVTDGLDGRVVREAIAIMDDNRIIATLYDIDNSGRYGTYWLEPVILELGDVQANWAAAKAEITGEGIPLPPDGDAATSPPDGSGDGSTTVVDTGTDGGFWNSPSDVVNPPGIADSGLTVTNSPNVTVPEPISFVVWGVIVSAGAIVRNRRRNQAERSAGDSD